MNVSFTPQARDDLASIRDWIAEDDKRLRRPLLAVAPAWRDPVSGRSESALFERRICCYYNVMESAVSWIDLLIGSAIPLTVIGVLWTRIQSGKGIGVRIIQFTAVAMTVPAVTLLALHGRLQGEAVAAIFGGVAGYLLSNIAKFDDREA